MCAILYIVLSDKDFTKHYYAGTERVCVTIPIQYLPFRESYVCNHTASPYSERFTFTGKERDPETGYTYHGARYYDADLMCSWFSVDPLSDKYPSLSPYNYCAWNPVKLVDLDGRKIDSCCTTVWESQKQAIRSRKNELFKERTNLENNTSKFGRYFRKKRMATLDERINSLEGTLTTMSNLEGDEKTTYTLSQVDNNGSFRYVIEGKKKAMVSIEFSSTASFVHEVTHAGQYYSNDIGFFSDGSVAAYDIFDEVQAYKAELAYNPSAFDRRERRMYQVTPDWVRPRSDNYKSLPNSSFRVDATMPGIIYRH